LYLNTKYKIHFEFTSNTKYKIHRMYFKYVFEILIFEILYNSDWLSYSSHFEEDDCQIDR